MFVAEIVGDKLLYTTGVLAARYRTLPITLGMAGAFMAKMAVAVLVGEAISRLPPVLVASITAISFLGVAFALWRKPDQPTAKDKTHTARKAAMVSFAAIFFSEWGDVGQVTAATLAGVLAAFLGAGIRRRIQEHVSPKVVRYVAVGLLLLLGLITVLEILIERR